jgi:hypothetical protein
VVVAVEVKVIIACEDPGVLPSESGTKKMN